MTGAIHLVLGLGGFGASMLATRLLGRLHMQVGEVIFGGVGAGFYGMLLYVVLAVFLAGLMVGRTLEYLGKTIEGREVTLAVIAFLAMPPVKRLFTGTSWHKWIAETF